MMLKTKSEQKLEHLKSLKRPLTDEESEELMRAMHAVYQHELHQRVLQKSRKEELKLLAKVRKEAGR